MVATQAGPGWSRANAGWANEDELLAHMRSLNEPKKKKKQP